MMDVNEILQKANAQTAFMNTLGIAQTSKVLIETADALVKSVDKILAANALDLARMSETNPMYDRLKLTVERIDAIAADMRNVAGLPSPLGKVLSEIERPNGMKIDKVTVPFGVIGVIYESRPNVTPDVFSLCFRSGNVCVLKSGSDARDSSTAIVEVIHEVLQRNGIPTEVCTLMPFDRESTAALLKAVGYVDLIIPRGSKNLINFVRQNATVPVIETGAGICHTYFDAAGDIVKGAEIIFNAKTRRVSVCNALDCVIIHASRLNDLPQICRKLAEKNVIIYADERSYTSLKGQYPYLEHATADSFGTEFQDYKLSIKTVDSFDQALAHIAVNSSKHSESIVTEDANAADLFTKMVDAACVYVNVSTAFTDGAQFGFGAEIGISTQKLHARGPMALPELTTYKYIIRGNGQVRKG